MRALHRQTHAYVNTPLARVAHFFDCFLFSRFNAALVTRADFTLKGKACDYDTQQKNQTYTTSMYTHGFEHEGDHFLRTGHSAKFMNEIRLERDVGAEKRMHKNVGPSSLSGRDNMLVADRRTEVLAGQEQLQAGKKTTSIPFQYEAKDLCLGRIYTKHFSAFDSALGHRFDEIKTYLSTTCTDVKRMHAAVALEVPGLGLFLTQPKWVGVLHNKRARTQMFKSKVLLAEFLSDHLVFCACGPDHESTLCDFHKKLQLAA